MWLVPLSEPQIDECMPFAGSGADAVAESLAALCSNPVTPRLESQQVSGRKRLSLSTIPEAKFSTIFDVLPRCKEWSFPDLRELTSLGSVRRKIALDRVTALAASAACGKHTANCTKTPHGLEGWY